MEKTPPKSSKRKSEQIPGQSSLLDFMGSTKKSRGSKSPVKISNKEIEIPKDEEVEKKIDELRKKSEIKEDKTNDNGSVSIEESKTAASLRVKPEETKKSPKKKSKSPKRKSKSPKKDSQKTSPMPKGTFPSYDNWLNDLGDWKVPLADYLASGKLKEIYNKVKPEYEAGIVYPPAKLIFNAFRRVSFTSVKAVIVGQDPYIKPNQAMGLSFSVPKTTRIPGSLKNIYSALKNDEKVNFKMPNPLHGDLTKWAEQGILLLNAVLTVKENKSNSHKGLGWGKFTDEVIKAIGNKKTGVVFLLWGRFAQAKKKFINKEKHRILEYCHPSPLAANSGADFTKCPHFSQANEYLVQKGNTPINWNVD